MKSISYSVVVLSGAILAQESTADQIVAQELFHVYDESEAEALAAQCYPMPWLESLLNDETVPEEDRYWLDCRVRALIATVSHVFFDADGNPLEIEAEWIQPAESYWRETFVVNWEGHESGTLPFQTSSELRVDPGISVDRFGSVIGEYAHVGIVSSLPMSRDGEISAAAYLTGNGYQPVIFKSDGTFSISRVTAGFCLCEVSSSGSRIIVASLGRPGEVDEFPPQVICLDRDGEVLWETTLVNRLPIGNPAPVITPDGRICCVVTRAEDFWNAEVRLMMQVFDMETGTELWRVENPSGTRISFSPDSRLIFMSGNAGEAKCFEAETGEEIWNDLRIQSSLSYASIRSLRGCTNASVLTLLLFPEDRYATSTTALLDFSGHVLAVDSYYGVMDVSPSGMFCITENSRSYSDGEALFVVRRVEGE